MSNTKKKEHKIEVLFDGTRYVCVEELGVVTFKRDGSLAGKAKWRDDQFVDSTALLPDGVFLQMEKLLKEAIDADYFD